MRLKRYLLWFAQDFFALDIKPFREAEINSLSKLFKISLNVINDTSDKKPFWIVETDADDKVLSKLVQRSFTLKYALRLLVFADNLDQFHKTLKQSLVDNSTNAFPENDSFRITVETFNKKITQKDKVDRIETLNYLPLKGEVKLSNADYELVYIEYYGVNHNDPLQEPQVILGEKLADGSRSLCSEVSLKHRKFIGNTSMEPQLAFIMANQALVAKGSLVFDPFVGSGSILVSAAKLGAYVLGADIDYLTLHGKSKPTRKYETTRAEDESLKANLEQYGCEKYYIDLLVNDFSLPIWNRSLELDAIITDRTIPREQGSSLLIGTQLFLPAPYGIREATEQIKFKQSKKHHAMNSDSIHYPSTSKYDLNSLYLDLLNFSATHLKMGGRLVTWFPIAIENYEPEVLPTHKSLALVSSSVQTLNKVAGRVLLTYEKIGTELEEEADYNIPNLRNRLFAASEISRRERRKLKQAQNPEKCQDSPD